MIATLLGWTGLPSWLQEFIAVGLVGLAVGGAVLAYEHHVYETGVRAQQATDAATLAQAQQLADAHTLALQKQSSAAHDAYLTEKANNDALITALASQPDASQLCKSVEDHQPVPGPSAPPSGVAGATASPGPLPKVSEGGTLSADDRIRMLLILASRADDLAAQVREFQSRAP